MTTGIQNTLPAASIRTRAARLLSTGVWQQHLAPAFGEVDEVAVRGDEPVRMIDDQACRAAEPEALVLASGPIVELFHSEMIGRPPAPDQ